MTPSARKVCGKRLIYSLLNGIVGDRGHGSGLSIRGIRRGRPAGEYYTAYARPTARDSDDRRKEIIAGTIVSFYSVEGFGD